MWFDCLNCLNVQLLVFDAVIYLFQGGTIRWIQDTVVGQGLAVSLSGFSNKAYNVEKKWTMEILNLKWIIFEIISIWLGAPKWNCFLNAMPTESISESLICIFIPVTLMKLKETKISNRSIGTENFCSHAVSER